MDKYYFTVPEYASIKRVNISVNKANMLSSKAYKLTTERNYRMKLRVQKPAIDSE